MQRASSALRGYSMRRAVAFFQRFFPSTTCRAITCSSWIFNTQFEQIRLSSDNLVRYQRELYLYPTRSSGRDLRSAYKRMVIDVHAPRPASTRS